MKENNISNVLEQKIFDVIFNQQTEGLLLHGKPLMNNEELAEYIANNLNNYLTEEEINELVYNNMGSLFDENTKAMFLKLYCLIAALKIDQAINTSLLKLDGGGNNPYSVFTQPKKFLWHKYMKEQIGVKLNIDLSKLINKMKAINN